MLSICCPSLQQYAFKNSISITHDISSAGSSSNKYNLEHNRIHIRQQASANSLLNKHNISGKCHGSLVTIYTTYKQCTVPWTLFTAATNLYDDYRLSYQLTRCQAFLVSQAVNRNLAY